LERLDVAVDAERLTGPVLALGESRKATMVATSCGDTMRRSEVASPA